MSLSFFQRDSESSYPEYKWHLVGVLDYSVEKCQYLVEEVLKEEKEEEEEEHKEEHEEEKKEEKEEENLLEDSPQEDEEVKPVKKRHKKSKSFDLFVFLCSVVTVLDIFLTGDICINTIFCSHCLANQSQKSLT